MTRLSKRFWIAVLMALILPPPLAADINGRKFKDQCVASQELERGMRLNERENLGAISCLQYLQGFRIAWIYHSLLAAERGVQPFHICFPKNLEGADISNQMIDIVIKYMNDNPTEGHLSVDLIVMRALGQYYPCAEK